MSKVQIDDYHCDNCKKTGLAELDTKTGEYTCLMCNGCKKIKLGKCPYCKKEDYYSVNEDFVSSDFGTDYIVSTCRCNNCGEGFNEYYSLDEVRFDDSKDGDEEVFYTNNLSDGDKQTIIKAINLLIEKEKDVNDYSRIINIMNGGCNRE